MLLHHLVRFLFQACIVGGSRPHYLKAKLFYLAKKGTVSRDLYPLTFFATLTHLSPDLHGEAVWRIRIILKRVRIHDVKKFVTDPGRTLIRIRIQAKNDRDPDPSKKGQVPGKSLKCYLKKRSYPIFCVYSN